jgi:hypothetical protein
VISTFFPHGRPLTDDEFLAIGETRQRVELLDGCLLISARGIPRHQFLVGALASALGGHVLSGVNVRLQPGRIVTPDVVVTTTTIDFDKPVIEAEAVLTIAEVAPAGSVIDEVWKRHCYAAAEIARYLLVDEVTGVIRGYELDADQYVEMPLQASQ